MFDQKMHDKYALHFVVYVARIDQGLDNRIVRRLAKKLVYCIVIPMNECSKSVYKKNSSDRQAPTLNLIE